LRYTCVWDDRDTTFGELRRFKLHYHLSDDTIEILETLPPNSGRDTCSTFLSRQRLPKEIIQMGKPGDKPVRTVLNVLGNFIEGGRYILDSLKTNAMNVNYYQCSDLMIGRVINVFGRKMLLTDCDEFTKEYNSKKFGINNFDPVATTSGYGSSEQMNRMNPPYTGIEKPPSRPFLSDDSIYVHEPPVKNSGIGGGRFLERTKVKKPGQAPYSTKLPEYYTFRDLFVGAVLNLNNFSFKLYDADAYCFDFMEKNAQQMFPNSNKSYVVQKFRTIIGASPEMQSALDAELKKCDSFASGTLDFASFFAAVSHVVGGQMCEQEVITLARAYALETKKDYEYQSVAAVTQEHLRKAGFEHFQKLKDALVTSDSFDHSSASVSHNDARVVAKGFKLPVPGYLLDMIFEHSRNELGNIDLRALLSALNWRESPVPHPRQEDDRRDDKKVFESTTLDRQQMKVNYAALLEEIKS